jgi:hypothetical protein
MLVIPASKECMELLGDLSELGYLVDVYNEASIEKDSERFIQSQQAKFLFEKYGALFYNHLLAIAITAEFPLNRVCEIYPALSPFFEVTKFHPKFLFLNLFTEEGLVIRQTRKGSALFSFVSKEEWFDEGDFESPSYQKFTHLDYGRSVTYTLRSLDMITRGDFGFFSGEGGTRHNKSLINEGLSRLNRLFPKMEFTEDMFAMDY